MASTFVWRDGPVLYRRFDVICAALGPPFLTRAPFSALEWRALSQLHAVARGHSRFVLWKTPISRLITAKSLLKRAENARFRSIATAVVVDERSNANVQAVVLDHRCSFAESAAAQLAELNCPFLFWYGPDRVDETVRELTAVLDRRQPPLGTKIHNPTEMRARSVLLHALTGPGWTPGEFIPESVCDEIGKLAEDWSNPDIHPAGGSRFWVTSEMALSAVIEPVTDPANRYGRIHRLISEQQKKLERQLQTSSLDFVVFAGHPSDGPLFALEVDGPYHDNADQHVRDQRKDALCWFAGIPLIRVRAEKVPLFPSATRATAEVIGNAKTLLRILIWVLVKYLTFDRDKRALRRTEIERKQREVFVKVMESQNLTVEDVERHLRKMEDILEWTRRRFEDVWMAMEGEIDWASDMSLCRPIPEPLSQDGVEADFVRRREFLEATGFELSSVECDRSPLSGALQAGLHYLRHELSDLGWQLGQPCFHQDESGTQIGLDMDSIHNHRKVQLSSGPIKLQGVSKYVDLQSVELEVAALSVMHQARACGRSGHLRRQP